MTGKLFLCGGGEDAQTFEVDEKFLYEVKKILYVPIAWKGGDFESCRKWFINAMGQHKKVEIDMLTDLTKSPDLRNYDAVYIGGGNTFKLLKEIRESGFDEKLLRYYKSGGTIYGGSAGAIIWGRDINIASICADADVNDVNLRNTGGFDKLNGHDIQCHYENSQLKENQDFIRKTKAPIIAIPEESALLVEDGKYGVIGTKSITLITEKTSKSFKPNSEFSL